MSINLSRSPFIIEIAETGQTGSKIELFLWTTGSQPASPQYTLSKLIPASNNISTFYNISPYVKEYYNFTTWQNLYNTYDAAISTDYVVQYAVKRYKNVGGAYTLLTTVTGEFMDGYTEFMDGMNSDSDFYVFLDEGTYLYNYDSDLPTDQANAMAGTIDLNFTDVNEFIRYTNLRTGVITNIAFSSLGIKTFSRVHLTNIADGNKVEFLRGASVRWTGTFKAQCEPKYQPVQVDFINKYGSWSRIFFQKAKSRNINVKADSYKLNPAALPYTPSNQGQVKEFNKTGTESIKLNTGWVNDGYAEYIQQLLLSEKVTLLDYENNILYTPVNVKTKSLKKQTGLNDGTMNYELTFDFAYDLINNVV